MATTSPVASHETCEVARLWFLPKKKKKLAVKRDVVERGVSRNDFKCDFGYVSWTCFSLFDLKWIWEVFWLLGRIVIELSLIFVNVLFSSDQFAYGMEIQPSKEAVLISCNLGFKIYWIKFWNLGLIAKFDLELTWLLVLLLINRLINISTCSPGIFQPKIWW